jgi:hypothetical protein
MGSVPLALSLLIEGCALTPPPLSPDAERELQGARRQARDVDDETLALRQVYQAKAAELEQVGVELEVLDAPLQEAVRLHTEQKLELDRYHQSIDGAQKFAERCAKEPDPLSAAEAGWSYVEHLGRYMSDPPRDAALAGLDRCRSILAKQVQAQLKGSIKDLQTEFATTIEDIFDENNPYRRGSLTASVSGTTLEVRMKGNFEGRKRHSQEQVDAWCERAWGLFTKIVLKNAHGTFTCNPDGSPSDLRASILANAHLDSSWVVTGDDPTPPGVGAAPQHHLVTQRRRDELLDKAESLRVQIEGFDEQAQQLADQAANLQTTEQRLLRAQQTRVEVWGQAKLGSAKNLQLTGGVFVGVGGAILLGLLAARQSELAGAREFTPIGVGVSVPVIVTGVLFLVGGHFRKKRVNDVLRCMATAASPTQCSSSR